MPVTISITADSPAALDMWLDRLRATGSDIRLTPPPTDTAIRAPDAAEDAGASANASANGDEGTDAAGDTRPMRGKNAQNAFERIMALIGAAPDEAALRSTLAGEAGVITRLPQDKKQALNVAANSRLATLKAGQGDQAGAQAVTNGGDGAPRVYPVRDLDGMVVGEPTDAHEAVSIIADIADQQCPDGRNAQALMEHNLETIRSLPDTEKALVKEIFTDLQKDAEKAASAGGGASTTDSAQELPDPGPDGVRAAIEALAAKVPYNEVAATLKRCGASRGSELNTPEKRRAFLAECAKVAA